MTDRWRVRKRRTDGLWVAIHPALGVRGVVSNWAAAFGVAYRAAVVEAKKPKPPNCMAHGTPACEMCSRTLPGGLADDGECRECVYYGQTGMHWDTCPYRNRAAVKEAQRGRNR